MLLLCLFFWLKIKNTSPTEIQRSQAQIIFEISLFFGGKYFFFVKKKILTKIRRSNAQINKFVIQIIQVYASWKGTYIRPIFDSIKKPRYEMSAFATFLSFSAEIVGKPREVAIWNKCSCTRYYYCLFYRPWTFMVKKRRGTIITDFVVECYGCSTSPW